MFGGTGAQRLQPKSRKWAWTGCFASCSPLSLRFSDVSHCVAEDDEEENPRPHEVLKATAYLSPFVCPSLSLSLSLSVCLPVCLSVCLSVSVSLPLSLSLSPPLPLLCTCLCSAFHSKTTNLKMSSHPRNDRGGRVVPKATQRRPRQVLWPSNAVVDRQGQSGPLGPSTVVCQLPSTLWILWPD